MCNEKDKEYKVIAKLRISSELIQAYFQRNPELKVKDLEWMAIKRAIEYIHENLH